eukprot:GHVN01017916.1.p1 GENE.GHVN01017916.1~~GHVN01017916.1.p1  ORF type:complete len:410 (-),score=100.01 GHVN01017916.1:367-1596(-)
MCGGRGLTEIETYPNVTEEAQQRQFTSPHIPLTKIMAHRSRHIASPRLQKVTDESSSFSDPGVELDDTHYQRDGSQQRPSTDTGSLGDDLFGSQQRPSTDTGSLGDDLFGFKVTPENTKQQYISPHQHTTSLNTQSHLTEESTNILKAPPVSARYHHHSVDSAHIRYGSQSYYAVGGAQTARATGPYGYNNKSNITGVALPATHGGSPLSSHETAVLGPNVVELNVYDLDNISSHINQYTRSWNVGAFHAGVSVCGVEYSFGQTNEPMPGVTAIRPQQHDVHIYRETVVMGHTHLTEMQVQVLIDYMRDEWSGNTYHILRKNCINFCDQFCCLLGVGGVPEWITSLQVSASRAGDHVEVGMAKLQQFDEAVGISAGLKKVGEKFGALAAFAKVVWGGDDERINPLDDDG